MLACCNRRREYQATVFISGEELFRQIHQDEFRLCLRRRIAQRHRGKLRDVPKAHWDLERQPEVGMPSVYPVESGDVLPPVLEKTF